ncbi:MAG TPA: thioesterase family protein [Casimicrobiaceae bacterium]|nr:thioesterase family protein [Casimicrobiaceae bacterium]
MTKPRQLVHTSHIPIRWGDMDAMGHVNNTVYFRYMEQARVDWAHAFARSLGQDAYADDGPLIVNASCTFLAPLTYPGEIEVRMFLDSPGRTSVESHYEISMDGRKYADGAAKLVWIDMKTTRPVPLPEALRALLDATDKPPSPTPAHAKPS